MSKLPFATYLHTICDVQNRDIVINEPYVVVTAAASTYGASFPAVNVYRSSNPAVFAADGAAGLAYLPALAPVMTRLEYRLGGGVPCDSVTVLTASPIAPVVEFHPSVVRFISYTVPEQGNPADSNSRYHFEFVRSDNSGTTTLWWPVSAGPVPILISLPVTLDELYARGFVD